jgi:bifunctional non-homologous end joining protein LigD
MVSRFILHRHRTRRGHFDLRLVHGPSLRTWSLLQEPPSRSGVRRLAIEREQLPVESLDQRLIYEQAFGSGQVYVWDEGEVEIVTASARQLSLFFRGEKLSGSYRLRRMDWYPGNQWLMEKIADRQASR